MKWALKFSTKGKAAGGGPDAGKPYQGPNSFRDGGSGRAGDITNGAAANDGAYRYPSGSDGEGGPLGGEYYEDGDGLDPDQERDTPILTPPDAANGAGGRGAAAGGGGGGGGGPDPQHQRGEKHEASPRDEDNSSATYEGEDNNGSSAPHFTVEDSEDRQQRGGGGGGEDMDYEDTRHQEQGVFDEDGDSQADSLQASKTARMKSFADDPEAHELEDNAEWDADKGDRRDGSGSPRGSPGDERSRNGGEDEGSDSDHSEAEPNGTEEGYASNPSRGVVDQEDRPLDHEEEEEEEDDLVDGEEEEEDDDDDDDEDEDGRHLDHGAVGNGTRGGGGGGGGHGYTNSGERMSRDQADLERRALAHAYADGLDGVGSREAPGYMPPGGDGSGGAYGSGGDRYQHRNMPPAPPAGGGGGGAANDISPVDARAAASLAMRTRLAQGGVAVGAERAGVQRPEPGPVLAPGQAAAAAAAALRRGPTPGSHSLPSMVLVPLEALKAHRRVPRSSDRRALVRYRDLPDRSRSFVVFVSHAWMRPHTTPSFAHPDTSSRGGEKYRLVAEAGDRIRAHLPPDVRVLLWIDYSCVDQDSTRRSKATMRGMREYMRRCDAILTVYPGDAADNGEEFLPNRFVKSCAWAGSYKSLAHYCTRGWCRLEMLLGQTEPLPQDGFMFNFLVPKKKKASGAKASVGDRPHFLYGAHQRPHNGRIDVVPRQSSRWFEEHHPEQGNFTHESDRDAIRAVLAKQTSTMAKRSAAIAARYGTDPRRGGGGGGGGGAARGGGGGQKLGGEEGEYGR